jgi:hypothetical protein
VTFKAGRYVGLNNRKIELSSFYKDVFIEFFLRPRGQQLDKDDCRVAEDDCRTEESIARDDMPIAEDEFQDDKDDLIEFFLRPRGQQLDKDDCCVAEDKYRRTIHRKAPQAYRTRQR